MIVPPLLIVSAALFWGMESGNLVVGVILGLLIGGIVLAPRRWELTDEDYVRVSDLTSVIFITSVILIFLSVETVAFLKTLVIWQPLALLPLIFAQLASGREKIIIGTRLGFNRKENYKHNPLDFKILYFAICLLSAAMANSRSQLFFPCIGTMFFWLLLVNRGKAFSRMTFSLVFLIAIGGGYLVFKGAEVVHGYVSAKTRMLIREYFYSKYADPFQSHLSFDSLGRLKTSGTIILRLKTEGNAPTLLRQASYENFNKQTWYSNLPFQYLVLNNLGWNLLPEPHLPDKKATIEFYLPKEKGLLPNLYGSYRVNGQTIYEIEQKNDGIVKIIDGAPLVTYDIFYNNSLRRDVDKPTKRNFSVHHEEDKFLKKIVENWQLEDLTSRDRVRKVRQFFTKSFTYSLNLKENLNYASPLENFLFESQTGYCELFATATTLLLRKVGVASRYVTGFVVAEKSELENKYIVRERHVHAWSEAYVNGQWIVVDTTPAGWLALDSKSRSSFEKVQDILSLLRLKYDHFRIRTEQNYKSVLSVIVIFLALILIYCIYRRMDTKKISSGTLLNIKAFKPVGSPLYEIEQRLKEIGCARHKNELFLVWAKRINETRNIELSTLEKLFQLHLKLRFDPAGLSHDEQKHLQGQAEQWLKAYSFSISTENLN